MRRKLSYLAILTCSIVSFLAVGPLAAQQSAVSAQQKTFASPQEAVTALVQAASSYDVDQLTAIFGPDGKDLITSADPVQSKNAAITFAGKANEKQEITPDPKNPNRQIVSVGNDDWPLPIPLAKKADGKWYFDSKAGRNEVLLRRIGANELDAIQICRGYVEAQRKYAEEAHDGINQYAQKIISTPGKQDGLYWVSADGTPGGPISEGIARAIQEGYTKKGPYHGYYFKILKGQGAAAHLGRLDYVIQGVMIGGFALIAAPAEYRVTGVKTFIVNQDGIVYEKDLGPDTLNIAKGIELYNPDKTWHRTDDQWQDDDEDSPATKATP